MSQFRVVRLGNIFVCTVVLSTLALAADQKSPTKLSDLPPEAQQAISAALARDLPGVQDSTLTASNGEKGNDFGTVAIDGNTVVVGASSASGLWTAPRTGAAYVFVKPSTGWANMTQTAMLTASDGQDGDQFGDSVGISGGTVVVGAGNATVNANQGQGAAYVFVEPSNGWTNMTETAKLTATDGAAYAGFGIAVAVSGNTVVVGSPYGTLQNVLPGTAYVFVEPSGGWTTMTQTAELTPSNSAPSDDFGYRISISSNTVVVGGGQCGGDCTGIAYLYDEPLNGWTNMNETAQLTPSEGGAEDLFASSVAISGNMVAVGSPNHGYESAGAVYVFVEPPGGWVSMTQTAELSVRNTSLACVGSSVSTTGNIVLTGADCTHDSTGIAYVFVEPSGGWQNSSTFAAKLSIPFQYGNDYFGEAVAISGTTGVVGAPAAPVSGPCRRGYCTPGPGEAFIFTKQ